MRAWIFVCTTLGMLANAPSAWAQRPEFPPIYPGDAKGSSPPPSPLGSKDGPPATHVYPNETGQRGLSDWITYRGHECCHGPVGGNTPIETELYLRVGPSFPFGGDIFGSILNTGWMIQGGGKALLYDPPHRRAWFVDLSLGNIRNGTRNSTFAHPAIIDGAPVTVRSFNRTMVGLGLGRLWELRGGDDGDANHWRVGLDIGGRWGSGNIQFHEIQHKSDVIGGLYIGAQSDLEFPLRCAPCFIQLGLRTEWGYTWSDVLSQVGQTSDVQDASILVHFGVRY